MEDLAFRRLLDHYYLHELPIKQRDIARQIGLKEYEQEVLSVLNEFFVDTAEGYINPRADAEIAKFKSFVESGKRGANKRWNSPPIATPLPAHSPPNATPIPTNNHKPLTNNHKPNINTAPEGVLQETWESFLAQRKLSRAAVTETVIKSIQKEADKIDWTLEQALTEIVARGWRGFKAEWVIEKQKAQPKSFFQQDLEIKQKRHDEMVGKTARQVIDITPNDFLGLK
jgi:hypothetical protein